MRLSGVVVTLAASFANTVECIKSGAVYKSDQLNEESKLLSQPDSVLNLAYGLGISEFYDIQSDNNLQDILYSNKEHNEAEIVLIINGVEDPKTLLGYSPNYEIDIKDDRQSNLFKSFLASIGEKMKIVRKSGLTFLSNEISLITKNGKLSNFYENIWSKYFNEDSTTNKIEKYWAEFKESCDQKSINHIKEKSFINELIQLDFLINEMLSNDELNVDDKLIFNFNSLINIYKKTGNSQTYQTCIEIVSTLINEKLMSENWNIKKTVIVLPLDQSLVSIKNNKMEKSNFQKREEKLFKKSIPGCFENELLCIESTESCSGHGKCSNDNGCWKCVCSPTVDGDNNNADANVRTTYWVGNSCEKVDYSSQFNLLFWTTIVLVLAIVSGVKLLFKCGNQELPGVLLAATVDTKTVN